MNNLVASQRLYRRLRRSIFWFFKQIFHLHDEPRYGDEEYTLQGVLEPEREHVVHELLEPLEEVSPMDLNGTYWTSLLARH